jgi:hypothetical protein
MLLGAGHRHQHCVLDLEVVLDVHIGKVRKIPRHELGSEIVVSGGEPLYLPTWGVVVA